MQNAVARRKGQKRASAAGEGAGVVTSSQVGRDPRQGFDGRARNPDGARDWPRLAKGLHTERSDRDVSRNLNSQNKKNHNKYGKFYLDIYNTFLKN